MPLNQAANLLLTFGMDLDGRDKLTNSPLLGSVTAMSSGGMSGFGFRHNSWSHVRWFAAAGRSTIFPACL
jgi:hypothetical protein